MSQISLDQITSINFLIREGIINERNHQNKQDMTGILRGKSRKMSNQSPNPRFRRLRKLTPRDKQTATRLIITGAAKTSVEVAKKENRVESRKRRQSFSGNCTTRVLTDQGFRPTLKKKKK